MIEGGIYVAVIEVNEKNFDKVIIGSDVPVMVDFFAGWCGPCKAIAPIIDEIADKNDGGYKVCKIDVGENRELAEKYGVVSVPTVMLFKDGQEVKRLTGVQGKSRLMQLLQ